MAYIGKSPGTGVRNRFIYTATASQTTFSGSDDHSRTLSYTDAEFTDVFLNGVKLNKSAYTATSGTSIVLGSAASVNDILEVLAFDTFSVFSGEFSQDVTIGADLTVDTSTLVVDSANNRVGIGTTSPAAKLTVNGSARALRSDDNTQYGDFGQDSSGGFITTHRPHASLYENFRFLASNNAGTVERMRIDSSGNLLISTTSSDPRNFTGGASGVRLGSDQPEFAVGTMFINRSATADGDIVSFRKEGSTVGSIETHGGKLQIGQGNANVQLSNADDAIIPTNGNGTVNDNAIDLGTSSARFNDLYLGGGVYVGGTGSANHLDDYEEGTFTPVFTRVSSAFSTTPTYSTQDGAYVKIGKFVHAEIEIRFNNNFSGGSGDYLIQNLPFTAANSLQGISWGLMTVFNHAWNFSNTFGYVSGTDVILGQNMALASTTADKYLTFTVQYTTN